MVKGSRRRATAGLCAFLTALAALPVVGQAATTQDAAASADAATASQSPLIQPEAPSSLFKATLGGADAELLVKGSWEASLLGSLDLQSESGGGLGLASTQPLLFTQTPELYLKFLLFKRFFVEARVSDDVTQALYAVGYQGGEGELLQEVRLGNNAISFPQLPFLSFGEGSYRSFGAMARIDSGDFEGRAMVRYDQADRVTKHFVGTSEVTDTVIAANAFIAGKYFATNNIPSGGITDLVVYVQSVNGTLSGSDGATYRKMDSSEYSYSGLTGLVTLYSAATTRVAVSYDSITASTPSSTDPLPNITVGGVLCDLVYYPDYRFSNGDLYPERQVLCRYSTTADASSSSVFVRNTATGLKDTSYSTRIDPAGFVEVTQGSTSPQNSLYRQPFTTMPWIYTTDFSSDTGSKTYAPVFDHEIVVRTYGSSAYITVDKNLVPGSVQVYRNGAPDYAFSVDTENGRLILASPPGLAEEITVTYLLETSERRAGSLVAGLGGLWTPSKDQSLWTALGLRWSIPGSSYAAGGTSNPGTVTLTAGEKKSGGSFTHDAAIAATYTQEEASGRYRMEGMESDSGYVTGFRPSSTSWDGTLEEISETALASAFPTLMSELHADGSTQMALYVSGDPTTPTPVQVDCSKVETLPPYQDFKTFSFFVNRGTVTTIGAMLTLAIDDGTGTSTYLSVTIPFGELTAGWNKVFFHYGTGDTRVYHQSSESSSAVAFTSATFSVNQSNLSFSRIRITTANLGASETFWIDEVLLEDSVGVAAANFQGALAYNDPKFQVGDGPMPLLKGLAVKADASAALNNDSFAAGGGSVATSAGPLGLALHARGSASESSQPYLRGGHELTLPVGDFPVKVDDQFDFDPSTGAFGRQDSLALTAPRAATLNLLQQSAWSPGSDSTEGLLTQEWKGALGLAGGIVDAELDASNRARPRQVPIGNDYGGAWISGFAYALPAYESDAELRSDKATIKLRLSPDAEIVSASIGTSAEPQSSTSAGNGIRNNTAVLRLTLPLFFQGLKVGPYYQRSWSDQRNGAADSLVSDAKLALSDFAGLPMLYENAPFTELWDSASSTRFAAQTSPDGSPLPAGSYAPEAGVTLSRDFGSNWYDLIAPSALAFAFRRELTRSDATITDAAVWDATMKFAAINMFGSQGAFPIGLPFDSDEYYTTIQAAISKYVGESTDRFDIQSQHLATLYKGESDSLSAENRFSLSTEPSESAWTETFRLDLTRKVERHWLLSLYRIIVPPPLVPPPAAPPTEPTATPPSPTPESSQQSPSPAAGGEAPPEGSGGASIASLYLHDLALRTPNVHSTIELAVSLNNTTTDETAPPLSWQFDESYVGKLTVPERLTVSAKGGLTQERDGTTGILLVGFTLGLDVTISF